MDMNYYTVEQVAQATGMGKDWLWKQCKERKIPHHRFGRAYRFTSDDLAALHDQTAVTSIPKEERPLVATGRGRRV